MAAAELAELGEEMDTQEIANRKMIEAGFPDSRRNADAGWPANELRKEMHTKRMMYFPMLWFARVGDLKMLRYLFAHGAEKDVLRARESGSTCMYWAAFYGHLPVMSWLLEVGGAEAITKKTEYGHTPLYFACRNGHLPEAQWLILNGALTLPPSHHVQRSIVQRDMEHGYTILSRLLAVSQDLGGRTPLSTFVAFLLGTLSTDQRSGSPQLWKLNGHGGLYKRTVASFVGLTKHEQEEVHTARELAEHMVALGLGGVNYRR